MSESVNVITVQSLLSIMPASKIRIVEVDEEGIYGWNKCGLNACPIISHYGLRCDIIKNLSDDLLHRCVHFVNAENSGNEYYIYVFTNPKEDQNA